MKVFKLWFLEMFRVIKRGNFSGIISRILSCRLVFSRFRSINLSRVSLLNSGKFMTYRLFFRERWVRFFKYLSIITKESGFRVKEFESKSKDCKNLEKKGFFRRDSSS